VFCSFEEISAVLLKIYILGLTAIAFILLSVPEVWPRSITSRSWFFYSVL